MGKPTAVEEETRNPLSLGDKPIGIVHNSQFQKKRGVSPIGCSQNPQEGRIRSFSFWTDTTTGVSGFASLSSL